MKDKLTDRVNALEKEITDLTAEYTDLGDRQQIVLKESLKKQGAVDVLKALIEADN